RYPVRASPRTGRAASSRPEKTVGNRLAKTRRESGGKRFPRVFLRLPDGLLHRQAPGKQRGDRGGKCATRAVVAAGQPLPAILAHDTVRVVEGVGHFRAGFVRTGNEHKFAAERGELARAFAE